MKRIDVKKQEKQTFGYILYLPENYDPKNKYPLILFLHGAGERGDGNEKLELVNVHGVSRYANSGEYELDAIVLCPQCPQGRVWNQFIFALYDLVDSVAEQYGADRNRMSITGISMGGFGTWEMAMTYPDKFCAFAPICGGGMAWRTDALKGKPIWAFHGSADPVVSITNSEEMVMAAKANGAEVTFTVFEGVGHNSWERAYTEHDIMGFLLDGSLLKEKK